VKGDGLLTIEKIPTLKLDADATRILIEDDGGDVTARRCVARRMQTSVQSKALSVQALRKGHATLIRRPHIGREILSLVLI
jgi:hypothetical protein